MSGLHNYGNTNEESLKFDINQSGPGAVPTFQEEMDTNCVLES